MTKKILSLLLPLVLCLSFASCSSDTNEPEGDNKDDISAKYEDILNYTEKEFGAGSAATPIGTEFTMMDLSFSSPDATIAFSLDKNSFAKLTVGGTFYNAIAPGGEVVTYDAGFKTGKGLSLANNVADFISKYGITEANALYKDISNGMYYPLKPSFAGTLTALFASNDGQSYQILSADDVKSFLSVRDVLSAGAYIDPKAVCDKFPDYNTVVSVDITADGQGGVSEFAMYKFDK